MADTGIRSAASSHESSIKGIAVVNVLLGLLIITAAFLTDEVVAFWNTLIVGVIVAGIGVANAWQAARHHADRIAVPAAVNIVLGAWLAASVLLVPMGNIGLFWANITFGILVSVFAAYNMWAARRDHLAVTGA